MSEKPVHPPLVCPHCNNIDGVTYFRTGMNALLSHMRERLNMKRLQCRETESENLNAQFMAYSEVCRLLEDQIYETEHGFDEARRGRLVALRCDRTLEMFPDKGTGIVGLDVPLVPEMSPEQTKNLRMATGLANGLQAPVEFENIEQEAQFYDTFPADDPRAWAQIETQFDTVENDDG